MSAHIPEQKNRMARVARPERRARWRFNPRGSVTGVSVDPAIPIVGAAARVDVELAADAIDLPLQIAVLELGERMNARALQHRVADDDAAEMRGMRDAAAREEGNRADDHDEVAGRNREDEIEIDRAIRIIEAVREQQTEDRPRRADGRR